MITKRNKDLYLVDVDGDTPGVVLHSPGDEPELVPNTQHSSEHGEGVGGPGLLVHLHTVQLTLPWPIIPQHHPALTVVLLLVVGVRG